VYSIIDPFIKELINSIICNINEEPPLPQAESR